jgi:cbb3-type cytochrome oxidase subunit 3
MSASEFSLLAVAIAFTGLVIWVYWPGHRQRLESFGSMPLEDDASPESPATDPDSPRNPGDATHPDKNKEERL